MKVQHNISALNTFRQMGVNNTGTTKSLEKLSSGYKINRAGDDAAGLAISEKMRAQVKGLNRASSNALDGISLIQAAEGALQETHSILQRMRELGIQAANDVNETEDRNAIQDEMNQLKTELNRIANTTEFNKKTVLDGSLKTGSFATKILAGTSVMAGAYIDPNFAAQKSAEDSVAGIYTVAMAAGAEGAIVTRTWQVDLTGMVAGETVSANVAIDNSDRPGGEQTTNNVLTFTATGIGDVDNATFINQLKEALQKVVKDYDISTSGTTLTFTGKGIGEGWKSPELTFEFNNANGGEAANEGDSHVFEVEPKDAEINITFNDPVGGTADWTVNTVPTDGFYKNGMFSDIDPANSGLVFEWADLTTAGSTILQVIEGKNLTFQTGANTGKHQTIEIGIKSMSSASLGVDNIRVDTHLSSQATVAAIENAIQTVSTQRGELGSVQNRLEHTIANLDTIAENLQDAESRIRDTDMAKEMMEFTKFNILNQASQAMMAQANSLPQGVLQLLR